jgi:hypothetical protein
MVAPVKITWDKKKVADGGTVKITAYDPYSKNNEWTAAASDGTEYTGAEVTSEGFHIFGLPPYGYYSAGIACYMSGYNWMQDNHDIWNNSMDLAGITNGGVIGFKYFGIEGLKKDTKGVKAFSGISKGDGATLNLRLTPGGMGAFKIKVMLDGPYANDTWKGKEIGTISVAADAPRRPTNFSVSVPSIEGLKGKHAIYLVAEGPEVQQPQNNRRQSDRPQQPQRPVGLFDLHGIGFTKSGTTFEVPVLPTVSIIADGKTLNLPSTPIRCTNANGLTDATRYQVYAPLTDKSVIKVIPSHPSVQFEVSPIVEGRATVKCTYNGLTKTYLIN